MDGEAILAISAVFILVVSVLYILLWSRRCHEVYDPGDGSIKIRCPGSPGAAIVLYGYQKPLKCPECGDPLTPPMLRNRWEKR